MQRDEWAGPRPEVPDDLVVRLAGLGDRLHFEVNETFVDGVRSESHGSEMSVEGRGCRLQRLERRQKPTLMLFTLGPAEGSSALISGEVPCGLSLFACILRRLRRPVHVGTQGRSLSSP